MPYITDCIPHEGSHAVFTFDVAYHTGAAMHYIQFMFDLCTQLHYIRLLSCRVDILYIIHPNLFRGNWFHNNCTVGKSQLKHVKVMKTHVSTSCRILRFEV